jgi:hypothetical protein
MVEDFWGRVDDPFESVSMPDKVWREDFDGRTGAFTNGDNTSVEMFASAIGQIVPRDGCDDHMLES